MWQYIKHDDHKGAYLHSILSAENTGRNLRKNKNALYRLCKVQNRFKIEKQDISRNRETALSYRADYLTHIVVAD